MKKQTNLLEMILGFGLILLIIGAVAKIEDLSKFLVINLNLKSNISIYTDLFTFIIICIFCGILYMLTKILKEFSIQQAIAQSIFNVSCFAIPIFLVYLIIKAL